MAHAVSRSILAIALWAAAPQIAVAAPFNGRGQAPRTEADARTQALGRARQAALEEALRAIPEPAEPGAVEAVLGASSAWTRAYRVLAWHDDGATLDVEVEVEIDLPRLRKRLLPSGSPTVGPRLGAVKLAAGCGSMGIGEADVRAQLLSTGLVSDGGQGSAVAFSVACKGLGPVSHTLLEGAEVQVQAAPSGQRATTIQTFGFAGDPSAAALSALQQAVTAWSRRPQARGGQIRIHVAVPARAAAVRRLQAAVARSVVGVRRVDLWGVAGDGGIQLVAVGPISAADLARQIRTLQAPGLSVRIAEVRNDRTIDIELGSPPGTPPRSAPQP